MSLAKKSKPRNQSPNPENAVNNPKERAQRKSNQTAPPTIKPSI